MRVDFGRSVSAVLDPVLVPQGFAAGQYGGHQVIYCAAHDAFSDRFPALPQSNAQDRGRGCCIDLVVEQDAAGVLRLSLEVQPLPETLRAVGLVDDAATVDRIGEAPLDTALPAVAEILSRLFRTAHA